MSLKNWGWQFHVALPGLLSLPLDSLFPPAFSAPAPSSSHACSPLKNVNGLPVGPADLVALGPCPIQEEGG